MSSADGSSVLLDGEAGAFIHVLAEAATRDEFEAIGRRHLADRGVRVLELAECDNLPAIQTRGDVPSDEFRYLSTFLRDDATCVIGDVYAYENDDE